MPEQAPKEKDSFSVGCKDQETRRKAEDIVARFGFRKKSRKEVRKDKIYAHLWRSLAQVNLADRNTRVLLTWLFSNDGRTDYDPSA